MTVISDGCRPVEAAARGGDAHGDAGPGYDFVFGRILVRFWPPELSSACTFDIVVLMSVKRLVLRHFYFKICSDFS